MVLRTDKRCLCEIQADLSFDVVEKIKKKQKRKKEKDKDLSDEQVSQELSRNPEEES